MLRVTLVATFFSLVMVFAQAHAQAPAGQSAPDNARAKVEADIDAAFRAAQGVKQPGPAEVKLLEQAALNLPANYVYVPAPQAGQILTALGNRVGDNLLGMIFPASDPDANWFIVLRYVSSGYIKDDDAKEWNADDLLSNIREGTVEANKERKTRGIPEMEIVGWVEKPAYDAVAHRLVWAMSSKDKGAPDSVEKGINYNTYALGRDGYISMNLVTDLRSIEVQKPIAKTMLAALTFRDGKRYADFSASTDRIAEYGLAALVGGVAAKKLGLLAIAAAFFAKFFKIIALAAFGGLALIGKFLKGKKQDTTPKV